VWRQALDLLTKGQDHEHRCSLVSVKTPLPMTGPGSFGSSGMKPTGMMKEFETQRPGGKPRIPEL
jgi:hypothetical protein